MMLLLWIIFAEASVARQSDDLLFQLPFIRFFAIV